MRTCLYSSRNRQVPTVPYQPFLPAIQRSDDGSSLTFRPQETQPFLPAIQRSADGSPNSRESTQSSSPHQSPLPPVAPHPHHYLPPGTEQSGRRVPIGYDSAGGELILGWPPTKPRRQAAHASRASLFTKKSRTSHIPQPVQLTPYNYKLTHHQPRQAASR